MAPRAGAEKKGTDDAAERENERNSRRVMSRVDTVSNTVFKHPVFKPKRERRDEKIDIPVILKTTAKPSLLTSEMLNEDVKLAEAAKKYAEACSNIGFRWRREEEVRRRKASPSAPAWPVSDTPSESYTIWNPVSSDSDRPDSDSPDSDSSDSGSGTISDSSDSVSCTLSNSLTMFFDFDTPSDAGSKVTDSESDLSYDSD